MAEKDQVYDFSFPGGKAPEGTTEEQVLFVLKLIAKTLGSIQADVEKIKRALSTG